MSEIKETKNSYVLSRYFAQRAHHKSLFTVEIYPGLFAEFGESKSKLGSKQYQLTKLTFSKQVYSITAVEFFRSNFHVKYLPYRHNGKKLPPIYKVVGNPQRLIRGGYIVICKNSDSLRKSTLEQDGIQFWKEYFYKKGAITTDKGQLNLAIPLLIDRFNQARSSLKEITTSDSRLFEELVAEIFSGFGYNIELTKKTRDGGKDIIALKKKNGTDDERVLIECKLRKDTVSVDVVRSLIGVAFTEKIQPTGIIVATLSTFSGEAEDLELGSWVPTKLELDLKDYEDILAWVKEYDAIQLSADSINSYFNSLLNI